MGSQSSEKDDLLGAPTIFRILSSSLDQLPSGKPVRVIPAMSNSELWTNGRAFSLL